MTPYSQERDNEVGKSKVVRHFAVDKDVRHKHGAPKMCRPPSRDEYRIDIGLRSTHEDAMQIFLARDDTFPCTCEQIECGWFPSTDFVTVTHHSRGIVACALLQQLDETSLLISVLRMSRKLSSPDAMMMTLYQSLNSAFPAILSLQVRCWERDMMVYTSAGFVHTHTLQHETTEREAVLCWAHSNKVTSHFRKLDERNPTALELLTPCAGNKCHEFGVIPCDMVRSSFILH